MVNQEQTRSEIREQVAGIINGKLKPEEITNSRRFLTVQSILHRMGRISFVKEMGLIARERLEKAGINYDINNPYKND